MQRPTEPRHADEIVSLNVDDLEVEELERRLELAVLMPMDLGDSARLKFDCDGFSCGSMTQCSNLDGCRNFRVG